MPPNTIEDLTSLGSVVFAIVTLAPGFIILYLRMQFVTGRLAKVSDMIFQLLLISAIYYAALLPFIIHASPLWYIDFLLILFIFPLLFGILLGIIHQHNLSRRLWELLNLNPVHPAPTSWDYTFGNLRVEQYIIVTLKDGAKVYGVYGGKSFASSELERRDLLIERLTNDMFGELEPGRRHALWINEGEISMVELINSEGG
jgi:hypothetical protein